MKPITRTIIWLALFSLAMGYMESAVVIYLRKIYYPEGFQFPLLPISKDIAITEFFREVATIIMLVSIAILVGKNATQRFMFFLFSFAIWDIFYYVFLKVLIGWPESLFTWDILFLIPVPWVGPVIAPCIISVTMILLSILVIYYEQKGRLVLISFFELILLIFGSITSIISFMWDYIIYISGSGRDNVAWTLSSDQEMFNEVKHYIPAHFNWWLFGLGEGMILIAIVLIFNRIKKQTGSF